MSQLRDHNTCMLLLLVPFYVYMFYPLTTYLCLPLGWLLGSSL